MNGLSRAILTQAATVFDTPFGVGVDLSTGFYILRPNPGVAGSPGAARIIFYTPNAADAADSGPTNITAFGSTFASYTRNSLAKCKALVRQTVSTNTSRVPGYGDWILFPSGTTITFPNAKGETFYGQAQNHSGANRRFMGGLGLYDPTDMTNAAKWNRGVCLLDFSAISYAINSDGGTHQFVYHIGRYESNFFIHGIQIKKTDSTTALALYTFNGPRSGILLQNTVADGATVNLTSINNTLESNGGSLSLLTSITSSGTLATATVPAGNSICANILNAGGTLTLNISGDTSNKYNGTFVCTYIDAQHFSYTFGGSSGAPATGTQLAVGVVVASMPDIIMAVDVVLNRCGFGYYGTLTAAHAINVQAGAGVRNFQALYCVTNHGGWQRGGSRNALAYNPGTTRYPITSLTRSGTTVTAVCPNTGPWSGRYAIIGGSNYPTNSKITSFTANSGFTYEVDANGAPATMGGAVAQAHLSGNTLTIDSLTSGTVAIGQVLVGPGVTQCNITAGSGSSWTFDGAAQTVGSSGTPITVNCCPYVLDPEAHGSNWDYGAIPDFFSHSWYIENNTHKVKFFGCLNMNDTFAPKLTGGPLDYRNNVSIRNCVEYLAQCYGNDSLGNSWPIPSVTTAKNNLCMFSQDIDPGSPRGFAHQILQPGVGSESSNFVILNASNVLDGSNSVASRTGPSTIANTGSYAVYAQFAPQSVAFNHGVVSGWAPTDTTDFSSSGVTKSFAHNITTEDVTPLPGTANMLLSAAPAAFQSGVAAAKLRDVANTFRAARPELAGVVPASGTGPGQGLNNPANLDTEQRCGDAMMMTPWLPWAEWYNEHVRQPMGR